MAGINLVKVMYVNKSQRENCLEVWTVCKTDSENQFKIFDNKSNGKFV